MKLRTSPIAASLIGAALLFGLGLQAQTTYPANTTYYISNSGCSDSNAGTSSSAPWCTFNNVNGNTFSSGDQILLAAGSSWNQELDLQGTGTSSNWITLSSYGSGANPIINRSDTSGDTRCLILTNPDYWNIENLQVENAGAGIVVEFITPNHNGLNISNIYAANMTGIQPGGSNGAADGINYSSGIVLTQPSTSNITLSSGQYTLNGLTISYVEGTGNYITITLYAPGGNFTASPPTWGLWNALLQNIYAHQDIQPGDGSIVIAGNNSTIMDSVFTDPLGYWYTGTTAALETQANNVVVINSMFTDVPSTGSYDEGGWVNQGYENGTQFYGDYFGGNAGAGIEFLTIGGSSQPGDYDTNNVVTSDLFVNNGLADGGNNSSSSQGAIATAGSFDATGTASQNLYYDNDGFDDIFGSGSATFSGFTFTNNLSADSASDTWNAYNGFSNTQAQNQWSYEYYPGTGGYSAWSNMGTYNAYGTNGIWSSWSSGTGASIWGSMMQPDACNTCLTARMWTAPKAGNISIRGWAAMHSTGGSGMLLGIWQNSTPIWGPTTIAGNNMTGFSTNVDVTVAANDKIWFLVNNNSSGNNTDDIISWSPNIVYTSSPSGLANANFQAPAQSSGGYQYGPMTYGWAFSNNSAGSAGVQANGSAWGAPSAPEGGTQTGFLQSAGSVSQSITFAEGIYNISFYAAQRSSDPGNQGIAVYVDSTLVGSWSTIPDSFTLLTTNNFTATAGSHVITIEGTSTNSYGYSAFIDDVVITGLANADFPAPAQSSGGYQYGPMTYGWAFSNNSAGSAGVQANGSAWGAPSAPEGGTQTAFLQSAGSVIQSATFNPGTYNISFYAAQRSSDPGYQGIAVYVDSTLVGSWSTIPDSFTLLTTNNFTVTAGVHVITIEGTSTNSYGYSAFIDDVEINAE